MLQSIDMYNVYLNSINMVMFRKDSKHESLKEPIISGRNIHETIKKNS